MSMYLSKHSVLLQKEIWASLSKLAKLCFDMHFVFGQVKPLILQNISNRHYRMHVFTTQLKTRFIIVFWKTEKCITQTYQNV